MKLSLLTILLFVSLPLKANQSCFYPSKKEGGSYIHFDDCGVIEGDKVTLAKLHTENVVYNEKGLACLLFSAKSVFYLHKSGRSHKVYRYDNACDYFKEGLTRGIVRDKMVFVNELLEVTIRPEFEFLTPFDYGHAVVCNGPFAEERRGEHTFRSGGKCGLIDKQGNLVVQANYGIENRKVFKHYINTHNHCPVPPVTSETSALCHAKRHISNMEYHGTDWQKIEVSAVGNTWLISFIEARVGSEEFTLVLNADTAHWESLSKEPHGKALLLENH